jgi:hypothetical protein
MFSDTGMRYRICLIWVRSSYVLTVHGRVQTIMTTLPQVTPLNVQTQYDLASHTARGSFQKDLANGPSPFF